METTAKKWMALSLCLGLMASCAQNAKQSDRLSNADEAAKTIAPQSYKQETNAKADSTSANGMTSSDAAKQKAGDNRKFIRTADIKFQVKNVVRATYAIEDVAAKNDGYVTYTNLASSVDNTETHAVSEDSSVESTHYTVANTMIVRVPNAHLDSFLKGLAQWVDFMDYRIIKADDVTLQMLSNHLSRQRSENLHQRLTNAIDRHGRKLNETTTAEQDASQVQEQRDNTLISDLGLADQVKYSTVNLNIYQHKETRQILVANDKSPKDFEPGFGKRIAMALKAGLGIFESLLVALANIWWLFLLLAAAYMGYRRLNRETPAKAQP